MDNQFDVIIVGGGPAGLYSGIVLKRGLPTQSAPEPLRVAIFERFFLGGLARFGHITFSKRWAFSGSKLIQALSKECEEVGVDIHNYTRVTRIVNEAEHVVVETNKGIFSAKYVILASGIVPAPETLAHRKVVLALGTPERVVHDTSGKNWNSVLLYGTDEKSLLDLKLELENREAFEKIGICVATDEAARQVARQVVTDQQESSDLLSRMPALKESVLEEYDGVLVDYNAYKVVNGSVPCIEMPGVKTVQNYVVTNPFGQTTCERIYAVGNVTNVISGILVGLSSALLTSLTIGRLLNPSTLHEPSGRFPWFPREANWEDSWLPFLEDITVDEWMSVKEEESHQ